MDAGRLKRDAKASTAQQLYLLEYLEAKPDVVNDKFIGVDGAHCRDKEWSILAEVLNSMGVAIKDAQKWRKYWKDLTPTLLDSRHRRILKNTISVRSKDATIREQRLKSGINGPIQLKDLTDIDRRIISVITPEAVEGVSKSVGEIAFEKIEQSPCEDEVEDISEFLLDDVVVPTIHEDTEPTPQSSQSSNEPSTSLQRNAFIRPPPRRQIKRRAAVARSSDESLKLYTKFETKKLRMEEQKLVLKEKKLQILKERNENQKIIINKIQELIDEMKNK